jgi:hypothetical protein
MIIIIIVIVAKSYSLCSSSKIEGRKYGTSHCDRGGNCRQIRIKNTTSRSRGGPRYQKECMTGDNLRPGVRFSSNPEEDVSGGRLVVGLQHSTDFGRYRKASLLNIGITPAGIGWHGGGTRTGLVRLPKPWRIGIWNGMLKVFNKKL